MEDWIHLPSNYPLTKLKRCHCTFKYFLMGLWVFSMTFFDLFLYFFQNIFDISFFNYFSWHFVTLHTLLLSKYFDAQLYLRFVMKVLPAHKLMTCGRCGPEADVTARSHISFVVHRGLQIQYKATAVMLISN